MKRIQLATLALCLVGACYGQELPTYVPSNGLVAWYSLDGNALDAGPNELHGIQDGVQAEMDRYGNPAMALNFPGGSSIDLSDSQLFKIDTAGTFSAWMHFENSPAYLDSSNPIFGRNSNNHDYGFSFGPRGAAEYFETTLGLSGSSYLSFTIDIDWTDWVHVVATFSSSSSLFNYYVNGQLIQTEPFLVDGLIHPECNTYIGKFRGTGGNCACQYYTGDLDELGIWNRALTAEEVMQLYSGSSTVGCTDSNACNFDSAATVNDGSCSYGCVFCGEGTVWNEELGACTAMSAPCGWNPDSDSDSVIGVSDLLALLAVYGDADQDGDGIMDSVDDCFGLVDACGDCNGEGMDMDGDGVCDDVDDCVGEFDACGICNGPGPTLMVIDSLIYVTDSVYIDQLGDWHVYEYVADTLWTLECAWQCGSNLNFFGDEYSTIQIGTQCWFAENLRTITYQNGDTIPAELTSAAWGAATEGAVTFYGEGNATIESGSGDGDNNLLVYGRLYNGYAVQDSREICPVGWHVSSDADWLELENYLGIPSSNVATLGWRGTDEGTKLKASDADVPGWNGSNEVGFNALPGGFRNHYGNFFYESEFAFYWSLGGAQGFTGSGLSRHLRTSQSGIARATYDNGDLNYGYSIRCVKNEDL